MNREKAEISVEQWSEMQEKMQILQNAVLLTPEEYAAFLQMLAQFQMQKQQQRMCRKKG